MTSLSIFKGFNLLGLRMNNFFITGEFGIIFTYLGVVSCGTCGGDIKTEF